jgi:hypothetical protein
MCCVTRDRYYSDQSVSDVETFQMVGFLIKGAESVRSFEIFHLYEFHDQNLAGVKDGVWVLSSVIRHLLDGKTRTMWGL